MYLQRFTIHIRSVFTLRTVAFKQRSIIKIAHPSKLRIAERRKILNDIPGIPEPRRITSHNKINLRGACTKRKKKIF